MERAIRAPIVHEAWNWIDRDDAVDDIAQIAFGEERDWLAGIRFCLSGSEANDLALSLAQAITGRHALATRERAYHGGVGLSRDTTVQPQWHGGLASEQGGVYPAPRTVKVVELPAPRGERIGPEPANPEGDARALKASDLGDVAGVIVDYTQGAVYSSPAYQDRLALLARGARALWIADEVVTGFGRTGRWFSFQEGTARPDIVTLGKGIGAGAAPAGAVAISRSLGRRIEGATWQTSGTFRGHPLSVAAIRAHLRVLHRHSLVERAATLDQTMYRLLSELSSAHPSVRRIDGRGLHWSIELHGTDWRTWRGDSPGEPLATRVSARSLERGALIQTSGEDGMLVLAPPLICTEGDLQALVEALDHGLDLADDECGRRRVG